jgi:hypothetical protein
MNRFISCLVATLLLLHVTVGCCWHHGHGGCAQQHMEIDRPATNQTSCGSHDGHQHTPGEHSHEGEHQPPCEQPDCVFNLVPAQRTLDDLSLVPAAWLMVEPTQALAVSAVECARPFDASDGYDVALPVRRHLLFSTLLI